MSISKVSNFLRQQYQVVPDNKNEAFLLHDIWTVILSYINLNNKPYCQIISYARVCRFFLQTCLQSCLSFRAIFIIKSLSDKSIIKPTPEPLFSYKSSSFLKYLTTDQRRKRYFFDQQTLFIEDLHNNEQNFIRIDLKKNYLLL